FEIISAKRLVSEVLQLMAERRPAAVCIAALAAGGLAHTRHLCKRIRSRFGTQKIILARWGASNAEQDADEWAGCGADYVGTTFEDTLQQLDEVAQYLRPAPEARSAAIP